MSDDEALIGEVIDRAGRALRPFSVVESFRVAWQPRHVELATEMRDAELRALIAGSRIEWPVRVHVEPGPFGVRDHIHTRAEVYPGGPFHPSHAIQHVELIGGSPALHVGGRPVAWYENWIRA